MKGGGGWSGASVGRSSREPLRAGEVGKWPRLWGLVRPLENVLRLAGSY